MLGDGPMCKVLVTTFSQRIDSVLLHEIFQTPFSNNIFNELKKKLPAGGTPETHTLRKQVAVEYLKVRFR